jgi:hypothetical protein
MIDPTREVTRDELHHPAGRDPSDAGNIYHGS